MIEQPCPISPKHDPEFIKEIFRQLEPWDVTKIEVDGIVYLKTRMQYD